MKKYVLLLVALFGAPGMALADLSGVWLCDEGGRYYVRQTGQEIHWYGEEKIANPRWSNVFHGKLSSRGDVITGNWADVPKGSTNGRGEMRIRVQKGGNVMLAYHKSGGFSCSKWTREGYRPRPIARSVPRAETARVREHRRSHTPPRQPAAAEDCIAFNPDNVRVSLHGARWKITEGNHWMYDFASDRMEATQAYEIIRHYRANQSCYVGRPNPSMHYLLVSGQAPSGGMRNEDCIAFNPSLLAVHQAAGSWKIVEGNHWLMDFGSNQAEAQQSLDVIRRHGFTFACYVGRPDPSFTYWRK
ncbi:MAG TPA: hypothetical protein VKA31_05465 [Mariprofundaceae bacterium]|nr:hypothetical protein [Mariprofundaceae bacterium]